MYYRDFVRFIYFVVTGYFCYRDGFSLELMFIHFLVLFIGFSFIEICLIFLRKK